MPQEGRLRAAVGRHAAVPLPSRRPPSGSHSRAWAWLQRSEQGRRRAAAQSPPARPADQSSLPAPPDPPAPPHQGLPLTPAGWVGLVPLDRASHLLRTSPHVAPPLVPEEEVPPVPN
eukprot:scaffold39005_cov47-Phaeocystis_antarctica.AAC.5